MDVDGNRELLYAGTGPGGVWCAMPLRPFKEPYMTLIGNTAWTRSPADPKGRGYGLAGALPVEAGGYRSDPYGPIQPMSCLSYTSRLISQASRGPRWPRRPWGTSRPDRAAIPSPVADARPRHLESHPHPPPPPTSSFTGWRVWGTFPRVADGIPRGDNDAARRRQPRLQTYPSEAQR
jgi:hypothetical protein